LENNSFSDTPNSFIKILKYLPLTPLMMHAILKPRRKKKQPFLDTPATLVVQPAYIAKGSRMVAFSTFLLAEGVLVWKQLFSQVLM
jgi:hypothetical protein